ncbi:MAG TPA: VWA domain-containing protein, partial [Thermoplasmata archaeon]|nr:VWA domain-containing protein [Thermoplasmata archaeon]
PDDRPPKDIHLLATIKQASARAGGSVISPLTGRAEIRHEDIMEKVRKPKSPSYVCIVIDTGGGAVEDLKVKSVIPTVLSILKASYERRDQVGMVFCSGNRPKLTETFTTDVERLSASIRETKFGGLTPLASGILMGQEYLRKKVGDRGGAVPILIVVSDGTANVPMYAGGHIRRELEKVAKYLRENKTNLYVIDVSLDGNHLVRQFSVDGGGLYYHPAFLSYIAKMEASKALLESFAKGDKEDAKEKGRDFLARLTGSKQPQEP